jgi:RNA polymerase sigma factor for flagellar operon FliA
MTELTLERDGHSTDLARPPATPATAPPDESRALWAGHRGGSAPGSRDRLVLHYAPLVRQVAGRVGTRLPAHVELEDLLQAGVFGLIDAVDRFEPELGVLFEVYAAQRIRGAILDELRAQDWVPRLVRHQEHELVKARELVEARLQRRATAVELAAELGVGPAEVRSILNQIQLISMEALDEWTAESLAAKGGDPVAILEAKEMSDQLSRCLARLPERDRTVLRLYYAEGLTLAQIGRRLDVTESRVSQLRSRALARLRIQFAETPAAQLELS